MYVCSTITSFFFQMNKVFENARLKTAVLQERAFRYWTLFNEFMRCIPVEQQALYSGCGGMHAGPWSARDLPGTPLMFSTFLWWLATPSVEVNPVVLLRTPLEKVISTSGPRGFSYTYTESLAYHLLSYLEDKECLLELKGKFADFGDVSALRREKSTVMKSIAM